MLGSRHWLSKRVVRKRSAKVAILGLFFFWGVTFSSTGMPAEIITQEPEYLPGETAVIDGFTFLSDEMVTLQVTRLDGSALPDPGSIPWDIAASGVGEFTTYWYVEWAYAGDSLLVTATGQTSGDVATAVFLAPGTNLDQLQNGTATTNPEWSNGNINGSNSCYSEGKSVPYRFFVSGLEGSTSHFFTIQMEWTKATIHALDYLTDYDATEDDAITFAGGPCGDSGTSAPAGCSDPTVSFALPDFLNTANYSGTIPPDFFTTVNPGFVLDGPRNLKAYNCTIDSVGKYVFNGTASDRTLDFIVYFTVDTTGGVGFFWGGHLAEGNPDAWGVGKGSASVSGAPYHMRAISLDGGGQANQDCSIQNGVICLPPNAGIICSSDTICNIGNYTYVCRDTASGANSWSWTVINGTIIGSSTDDSVIYTASAGLMPGDSIYVLVESCDSSSGCPGEFCCGYDSVAIPVVDCNTPPTVTCAADTTVALCSLTTVCIPGFSCDDIDGNLASCDVSLGTLSGDTVCFTPTAAGIYTIVLIATDDHGAADTCSTSVTIELNSPPVASCRADTAIFACDLSPITLPGFSCSDVDGNLVSCVASPGTLSGDEVTFTPVAGVNTITLTATDECGEQDSCQTIVTVTVNSPPVCDLPKDTSYFVCGDTTFSFPVSATDIDGNLSGCTKTSGVGNFDGSTWTFTTSGPGVYSATFSCTDSCGASCGGTVNITVTYNQPPVATCPGDESYNFLCEPSEICHGSGFTYTDPDNNVVEESVNFGTLINGSVCFTPDTAGVYTIIYTVTDTCDASDQCSSHVTVTYTNQPPVASCHDDASMFVCDLSPITLPGFSCSDPDGNLATCVATGGNLSGDAVTFTPVVGVNTIILTATDSCDLTDACTTKVTVSLNSPPEATCPGDTTMFVCDLSDITLGGFGCSDPDDNLDSCRVNIGTLSGDEVTFPPAVGVNRIILTATDVCDETASCTTLVTVVLNQMPYLTVQNDDTVFLCQTEERCYPFDMGDPDYPQYHGPPTAYLLSETGYIDGDSVCFTPVEGVDSTYWFVIQVCDSCGTPSNPAPPSPPNSCVIDSFSVTVKFNQPPVATCPNDQVISLECGPSPTNICVGGFEASDPDGNIDTVYADPGVWTPGLNDVCFTADTVGVYTITFTVIDSCGEIDQCQTNITVEDANIPPVATCPGDTAITLCDLEEICLPGFSCTDASGNLVSCDVEGGQLVGDEVCFTPVEGVNIITLFAVDGCGVVDSCKTTVTVILIPPVNIDDTSYTIALCESGPVCVSLPDVTGGAPPYTFTFDGRPVSDTVCFYLADDTTITGQVVVTDSCGDSDTATLTVIATVNTAPVVSVDAPGSVFLCEIGDTVCVDLTIIDPDNSLTVTSQLGTVNLDDSTVCFVPTGAGQYCDMVIVTDSCGLADTAQYCITVQINRPPQCGFPGDQSIFQCEPAEVVLPISASDPDGNLVGCQKISGPGQLIDGEWHYTPSGDETVTVVIRCTDECGAFCEGDFTINFNINDPPIAQCRDNIYYTLPALNEICVTGFGCEDPDFNLTSCSVTANGAPAPIVGDEVCFVPQWGENTIQVTAVDACDDTDICVTTVVVNQVFDCPIVTIEKTHGTLQGHYEEVTITIENGSYDIGGFDFLIAYDASALTPVQVAPGQLLEDCDWEYLSYRFGVDGNCGSACPSGLLRIFALAETNNGPSYPSCFGPPDDENPYSLVVITFYVTNDRTYNCQYVPITFFWMDCGDNVFSSVRGDSLFLDSRIFDFEGNLIWDEGDDDFFPESARIPFIGAPDYCLAGDKVIPVRCIDMYEGGIDIVCSDSIDVRGDINVNGVGYEVADAVMFTNYFISGLAAFGNHIEASSAASDVNADGIALSIADLVYMVRIITGDAPPMPKPLPGGGMTVTTRTSDGEMIVEYDASTAVGAALLIFSVDGSIGSPGPGEGAAGMEITYGLHGNELRVLVYNIGDRVIAAGSHTLLTIPYNGSLTLMEVEAADYAGAILDVSTRNIPDGFALDQNYPNPFNPYTSISLSLSTASDWTLAIYNIAGQMIREFSGRSEAGIVRVTWDGTDGSGSKVATGIYIYRVVAGDYTETRKMVLMK